MVIRFIGAGTRPGVQNRVLATAWTFPNIVTIVRFLGVPLFVWFLVREEYGPAVVTLVILGSTDWVDGYLARRFDQISTVGRWLDPVADRTALIVVAVAFVMNGIAPAWLVWILVVPDVLLILNMFILFRGPYHLPVSNIGKIRTALLLVGLPLLLLHRVPGYEQPWILLAANALLILGCIGHLLAFYGYLTAAHRQYRRQKRRQRRIDGTAG